LEEWVDEDNFGPTITEEDTQISANKNSRVVVLKHMFTLKELDEEPSLLLDLKEDVREECETLGEVTNVVLYDVGDDASPFSCFSLTKRLQKEPDGVMTVKFRDPISAQACVLVRISFSFVPSHASPCSVANVESPQTVAENARALFFRTQG
jgi:HIV Tat-specific factor 1